MLKLKPLTINWLAIGAHIPMIIFIAPRMISSKTCTCFRLLGPCFKTGQMKRFSHKMSNVQREASSLQRAQFNICNDFACHACTWSHETQHMFPHAQSIDITKPSRHAKQDTPHAYTSTRCTETCRKASICILQSWFSSAFHLLWLQQFQVLLTFFSKSFSHFPHGTCLLSVSNQCLALDENYHPFCAPLPRNATLRCLPYIGLCARHAGVSPSMLLFPKRLSGTNQLVKQLHCAIRNQRFQLSTWAVLCSFAITKRILFSLLSSAYLYA